jgi:hypothetical protein
MASLLRKNQSIGALSGILSHTDGAIYNAGLDLIFLNKKPVYWWRYCDAADDDAFERVPFLCCFILPC